MTEEVLNDNLSDDQKITDEVILQLKPLIFRTISDDDIIKFIHLQCQKVLEIAKTKNDSKEVARAINLQTLDILGTVMGESRKVDIDYLVSQMQDSGYAFVVLHNHPSDMHFSVLDIKTFINSDNLTILIVLGNLGSIYVLEKTRLPELNEILSIKKTLLNWQNKIISFETVIEHLGKFGIVYNEI